MNKKLISVAAVGALLIGLAGCASGGAGAGAGAETDGARAPSPSEDLVVGFAQVGAESGWRTANTTDSRRRRRGRDRPQVLGRAAEAGEPDQGDPLLHPAAGRLHRLLARRGVRLGRGAERGQGRGHPGHPHRPRRRHRGRPPSTRPSSARTSSRRASRAGDWLTEESGDGRTRARSRSSSSRAPRAPHPRSTAPRASPTSSARTTKFEDRRQPVR